MGDRALLDANVLVPISLCDLLLRVAEVGLFAPRWSSEILREVRRGVARALLKRGTDPSDAMASVDRRIKDMLLAFPHASVVGWEPLVERVTLPDPHDRHVVAAAWKSGAKVIVTQNVTDFPTETLPAGFRVVTADAFLLGLLERSRPQVHACLYAQARDTGKHGKAALDLAAVLARLATVTPEFVATMRKELADS